MCWIKSPNQIKSLILLMQWESQDSALYTVDVFWPQLPIPNQPMQYSGNPGVSSEYLSFFFVQPLSYALNFCTGIFHWKIDLSIQRLQLLLSRCKQIFKNGFSGCKNRICQHKFKWEARNNGWMKKN